MTLEQRISALATAIGVDIKGLLNSPGGGGVKGSTSVLFLDKDEASVTVNNNTIAANTIIVPTIDVVSDEVFVEDFHLQLKKEVGVGFTIFCKPKLGRHTGNVNINYIIL